MTAFQKIVIRLLLTIVELVDHGQIRSEGKNAVAEARLMLKIHS